MDASEKVVQQQRLLEDLLSLPFVAVFGDVVLVFKGGEEVPYYKALLSLLRWANLSYRPPTLTPYFILISPQPWLEDTAT